MKLGNRFNQGRKTRMWIDDPYCALCGSNQNCSVHHIYGCKEKHSSSLINSIMLCEMHHRQADTHNTHECGDEHRIKYLSISLPRFVRYGFSFLKEDKGFIKSVQEDVNEVLKTIRK